MPSGAHILVDTTGARMAEAGGWVGGVGVNTPGFLYFHGPADAVGGGEVETKPIWPGGAGKCGIRSSKS